VSGHFVIECDEILRNVLRFERREWRWKFSLPLDALRIASFLPVAVLIFVVCQDGDGNIGKEFDTYYFHIGYTYV
jgi:hypothetical protein